MEEGMKLWYEYMQSYEDNPMEIDWTTEEYIESWKKMKETMALAPGIHTTHVKCLHSSTISAEIISSMALIPLISGHVPKQWKLVVDIMLLKKPNEYRPEKMKTIKI